MQNCCTGRINAEEKISIESFLCESDDNYMTFQCALKYNLSYILLLLHCSMMPGYQVYKSLSDRRQHAEDFRLPKCRGQGVHLLPRVAQMRNSNAEEGP